MDNPVGREETYMFNVNNESLETSQVTFGFRIHGRTVDRKIIDSRPFHHK